MSVGGSLMIACCGRLAGAILGISFAFCASHSIGAKAQEAAAGSASSGACSSNGATFDDALSKPHWNGWGVDPSQHRFQSSDMARLSKAVPPPETEVGVQLPRRDPIGRAADNRRRTPVCRHPRGKGLFARRQERMHVFEVEAHKGVRSAIVIGQRGNSWAAYFADLGANVHSVDALTRKELWRTKVDDHPAAVITGSPTLIGTTLLVPVSSYEEVTGANKSSLAAPSAAASLH